MALITYDSFIYKAYEKILNKLGDIQWNWLKEKLTGRRYYDLTDAVLQDIRTALATNYFIICTRRKTVISTYLIALATMVKTGKFGHWCHVLVNLEEDNPETDNQFQLYEATSDGAHIATFMEVFDCDSVALLRPKNIAVEDWHGVIERTKKDLGKPYDDMFNLYDDTHISCVEMVRSALMTIPDYEKKFPHFEAQIAKVKNLTPQMFYDCEDFEVVYEVRR
jgi:hypothetical protein